MRVGIDARGIRPEPDGIGRYTHQLIRACATAYPKAELIVWCLPTAVDSLTRLAPVRPAVCNRHHLSRYTVKVFGRQINRAGVDIFHSPFFLVPGGVECPVLVTVHDLMALDMPDFFDDSSSWTAWYKRWFHRRFVPSCLRSADRVLAVSRWVAQRVEAFGVPKEKVRLLPNAIDSQFSSTPHGSDHSVLQSLRLEPVFFLHVGRWKRYKNLPFLLEAYQHYLARTTRPSARLVLCRGGGTDQRVDMALKQLNLKGQVKILQAVPDRMLPSLYRSALALVQPSVCEGFGLPVIEAMACGTPVICSSGGALPEVAGEAALIVESWESRAWAEALERVAGDQNLRAQLRSKGLARSAQYRLESMSKALAGIYREILS